MNRIAIAAATLALAFAAAPAEAGIRRNGPELNGIRTNGLELNGIRRNGVESGATVATPRLEGVVLRDGTVLRHADR